MLRLTVIVRGRHYSLFYNVEFPLKWPFNVKVTHANGIRPHTTRLFTRDLYFDTAPNRKDITRCVIRNGKGIRTIHTTGRTIGCKQFPHRRMRVSQDALLHDFRFDLLRDAKARRRIRVRRVFELVTKMNFLRDNGRLIHAFTMFLLRRFRHFFFNGNAGDKSVDARNGFIRDDTGRCQGTLTLY